MSEDVFKTAIRELESLTTLFAKGKANPEEESELRVELMDLISTIEATLATSKEKNIDFLVSLKEVKNFIFSWNPSNNWSKFQKTLSNFLYDVIVKAKAVVIISQEQLNLETNKIKDELETLKSELSDLKNLIKSLAQGKNGVVKNKEIDSSPINEPLTLSIKTLNEEIEPEGQEFSSLKKEHQEITSISEDFQTEEDFSSENDLASQENETSIFTADKTIQKLSDDVAYENRTETVLSRMKTMITEAEIETEKQMKSFKENLSNEEIVNENNDSFTFPPPPIDGDESNFKDEILSKSSEITLKQKMLEDISSADPYMLLLTLEAEKYRLEKEIEKNETDFQEGIKDKSEFDESINLINNELTLIREKIDFLRKELTS